MRLLEIRAGQRTCGQFCIADVKVQDAAAVQGDEIAVLDLGEHSAGQGLGGQVNSKGHLAGGTRKSAIGDQSYFETPIHDDREIGNQLMQLGHAVGPRPLKAHHCDQISIHFSGLKGCCHFLLTMKNHGRGSQFGVDPLNQGRDLDDGHHCGQGAC